MGRGRTGYRRRERTAQRSVPTEARPETRSHADTKTPGEDQGRAFLDEGTNDIRSAPVGRSRDCTLFIVPGIAHPDKEPIGPGVHGWRFSAFLASAAAMSAHEGARQRCKV